MIVITNVKKKHIGTNINNKGLIGISKINVDIANPNDMATMIKNPILLEGLISSFSFCSSSVVTMFKCLLILLSIVLFVLLLILENQ